jgi:hypothetical protein
MSEGFCQFRAGQSAQFTFHDRPAAPDIVPEELRMPPAERYRCDGLSALPK